MKGQPQLAHDAWRVEDDEEAIPGDWVRKQHEDGGMGEEKRRRARKGRQQMRESEERQQ